MTTENQDHLIDCPHCEGHGGGDVYTASYDPQDAIWKNCDHCGGDGAIAPAATN